MKTQGGFGTGSEGMLHRLTTIVAKFDCFETSMFGEVHKASDQHGRVRGNASQTVCVEH